MKTAGKRFDVFKAMVEPAYSLVKGYRSEVDMMGTYILLLKGLFLSDV
jgi:hypothetical protein